MNYIYTIGHSTVSIECFIKNLKLYQIDTIVDVRSVPYSRFANQYNKEKLSNILKTNKIFYIPLGNKLGARYEDNGLLFEDGKVNFSKVSETDNFQEGIFRVEDGIKKGYNIALMCSEKNPIECHRFSLISNFLHKKGYLVKHIVESNVFKHILLQNKLLEFYKEYHKITTDLNRIITFQNMQSTLFDDDGIDENTLYLKLNQLVGFNPIEIKRK